MRVEGNCEVWLVHLTTGWMLQCQEVKARLVTQGSNKPWVQDGGGEIRMSASRAVYADFVFAWLRKQVVVASIP